MFIRIFKKSKPFNRRRSRRVSVKLETIVSGRDEYGSGFKTRAQVVDANGTGGCLVFDRDVREGDVLKLYGSYGRNFLINVRWQKYEMLEDLRYLGFSIVKSLGAWNGLISGSRHEQKLAAPARGK